MISMIAAMGKGRVIGKGNQLPWHLPADLKHFKRVTMGKPILMGRKTFESIGKPLPGRRNLVLTRQAPDPVSGVEYFASIDAALHALHSEPDIMIIGGAMLYASALSRAERLYLTFIDVEIEGDAFFPQWESSEWVECSSESHAPDEKNPYAYRFVELKRRRA